MRSCISGSLNNDFDFCFQTMFSLSSHGQRRSLPLMRAALIKPLGFQRTLTTWTDCQLFHNSSVTLRGKMCVCKLQFEALPCLSSSSLCLKVKINAPRFLFMACSGLWMRMDIRNFAVADRLYQRICFFGATREEKHQPLLAVGGFCDEHNLAVWLLEHLFAWKLRAPSWWWTRVNTKHPMA